MRFNEFTSPAPGTGSLDAAAATAQTALRQGPPYPEDQSQDVKDLQSKLQALGYSVGATGIDGRYGERTARAVSAFKQDNNVQGDGSSMSTADMNKLATATPVANPTQTGNHAASTGKNADLDDLGNVEFAQGQGQGRVQMRNSGATRNQPIQQRLMDILNSAAEEAGVDVVVFSGGQDARGQGTRRTGSVRHDNGNAADVWIYSGGRRLSTSREDPIVANFIRAAVAAGAKGIGAGPGYMDSVGIHVDIVGDSAGGSVTWGRGSRSATTPRYVTAAYTAGQTGTGTV